MWMSFNIFLCSSLKMLIINKSPALCRGVSAIDSFHRYGVQSIYSFRRSNVKSSSFDDFVLELAQQVHTFFSFVCGFCTNMVLAFM